MLYILFNAKRRFTTISVLVLAVLLVISLLPSGFAGKSKLNTVVSADASTYSIKDIALNPGKNESEMNVTYYTSTNPVATKVQVSYKALMTGGNFPTGSNAVTFTGTSSEAATVSSTVYYSNKVTIAPLSPNIEYVYRVGDGTDANWSPVYSFKTQDPYTYSVMFVGDPQIGASGSVTNDTYGWTNTLNKAVAQFPNMSFIMSAGDQVETNNSESQYDAYLSPSVLRSLPVATVVGNHDGSVNYTYHFNQPNQSTLGATAVSPGDYYYTKGDSLFMVLNTNNSSAAAHVQFMKETVAAVPNAKWKFVTFHHDIYGAGTHSLESAITNLRAGLFPTFDELNVDMIFMGHDHSYVRTFVMKGDIPQKNQLVDSQGRDVNPVGSTYLTANSASGSKYYELKTTPEVYSAVRSQLHVPTFSTIDVTPTSVTIKTFRTDTMEMVDTYGMVKDTEAKVYAKPTQEAHPTTFEYYYALTKGNSVNTVDATFGFDSTRIKFTKAELVSPNAGVIDSKLAADGKSVRVVAGLTTPISTIAATDVVKLTFELVPSNPTKLAIAEITLNNSSTSSSGVNKDVKSSITGKTGSIVRYYDFTGDGLTTGADLSKALDFYRASSQDPNWNTSKVADVNLDGVVDITDFTMILKQIFE
ncbi:hypothetical protein EHS13_32615 [Paenibacillus psychroresistens]|uniref:Dockerin domain-containing protein n=1 Tax=Paenibacillus psychroresistens TaxID=1778678 RepID=A0A6B8RS68_9BACL|nr:fibronectin type III domain-containing protein [Paenibacillus psychroresistens]QGQ99271.1 hypothetical protein EHS13_32615 [Paenibacillus psychroresistens]